MSIPANVFILFVAHQNCLHFRWIFDVHRPVNKNLQKCQFQNENLNLNWIFTKWMIITAFKTWIHAQIKQENELRIRKICCKQFSMCLVYKSIQLKTGWLGDDDMQFTH